MPCPGCGLSRATLALLRGDVMGSLSLHAFAPALLVAMGLLLASALAGPGKRARLAETMRRIELRTGATAWLLGALLVYWVTRLVLDYRHLGMAYP